MTTGTTLFCRSAQHLQKSVFERATCLQEHDRGCHTKVLSRVHFSPAIKLASAGLRVYVSSMLTNLGSTDCSTACFGAMADRKMFKAACTGSLCLGQRPLYAWTTLSMTCRHCCSTASSTVSSSASTLARATSSATCIGKEYVAASEPQTGRQILLSRSCAARRMPDPKLNAHTKFYCTHEGTTWQQLQVAPITN